MTSLNRRTFLQFGSLGAVGAVLTACSPQGSTGATSSGGDSMTLRINSFGGTFQEAIQSVVVDSFQQKTGAKVEITTAISSEALTQLRAAQGSTPVFDVAYMDLVPIYQAIEAGLLDKIETSKVPSLTDIYPLAVDPEGYWVAELVSMTGIAYNAEKVTTPPTSWADLWKPEFEGRVAIPNISGTAGYQFLTMMAKLNGGGEDNIDPGFERISALKPNIAAIYSKPDEMSRLLSSGEAWIGPWYADRLSSLKKEGAPVAFATPKEGAVAILSSMCLPKGSPQSDLAHQYLDHQLSAEINGKFVTTIAEGPTNSKVEMDEQFIKDNYLPYGPEEIEKLVSVDAKLIAKHLPEWVTRWEQEIAN